jgi:site-specific DNA-cytosine methylase
MMTSPHIREITHFHLFCGLGGGAKGFNKGQARVGNMEAKFRCLGGIDVDSASIADFTRLAGVQGTVLDLFSREQYVAFHGHEPRSHWIEATPLDIRCAAGNERPNIVFLSAPCKGFSGLLSESRSKTGKYQALNGLTLRGIWLMLEAWKNDPPELIVFENVPRIANRGRYLLDQIVALLRAYGYAVAETTHDCGELGNLAQSRKRFLLVRRHMEKVPPFLYEPEKRSLRAVGDILGRMPLPGDLRTGPMHRVLSLQWKTWVRLAFVEAGSDWRSLNKLRVVDGKLADYLICPEMHSGMLGVNGWDEPAGTVTSRGRPNNGNFSVADPRFQGLEYSQYGVLDWKESMGAIIAVKAPGQGRFSVADPRLSGIRHNNVFRIVKWEQHSQAVTAGQSPTAGGLGVADPRPQWENRYGNLHVTEWNEPSKTVIAGGKGVQGGWLSVADPRCIHREKGDNYLTGGHYGVVPWDSPTGAVSASAGCDNGR